MLTFCEHYYCIFFVVCYNNNIKIRLSGDLIFMFHMKHLEDKMDIQAVIQSIVQLGFSVVMCLLMGWYVKYREDKNDTQLNDLLMKHHEEIKVIKDQHNSETQKVVEALNNNTIAIQRLADKLEK